MAAPTTTTPGAEAAVNATVRYCLVPTLKGQTGKAARRALAAADCKVGTVKKTKKRRPFKQVLGQSVKPGSSVSDTTLVNFKVSKKAKPRAKPRCKKGKKAGRKKCPRKKKPR
jgi:beta-lactam-binding protein with PASTA domain